jgi:hypothetical protein
MYIVTLPMGTACQAAGLRVTFAGSQAVVVCQDGPERQTYWATRYRFLRDNPLAD